MKYVFLSLVLTGCYTRDYKEITRQVGEYGVQTIHVEDRTCMIYRDQDGHDTVCWKTTKGIKQ